MNNQFRYISKLLLPVLFFPFFIWANDGLRKSQEGFWAKLIDAKGSERVDLLNKLAGLYINSSLYNPDSALFYAEQSLHYARRINDVRGYAKSAEQCANISLQLSLVTKGLEYYNLAYRLGPQSGYQHLQAAALRGIGHALWYSGRFKQAVDTMLRARDYFQQPGLEREHADAVMVISSIYGDMGNYEKAFEYARQSLLLNQQSGFKANIILSLVQMGYLYKNVNDYSRAFYYFNQAFAFNPPSEEWCYRHLCNRTGDLYMEQKKYDSAFYFYS